MAASTIFTVAELRGVTNNFAAERLVGAGGCGEVFQAGGVLTTRTELDVEAPPPPPRVCLSIHPEGTVVGMSDLVVSCLLVLNGPRPRGFSGRGSAWR
jgi:hypothetical protein